MQLRSMFLSMAAAVAGLGLSAAANAAPIVYNFTFFDGGGSQVGSGALSVEQSVLDAAPDLSAINPVGQAPAGSKFVEIGDLSSLSFTVFGTTYDLTDHMPVVAVTVEGVIFNADESFRQFIDANVPLSPQDGSATGVNFGAVGSRLLFDETIPSGFRTELAQGDRCASYTAGCTFSVTRAELPAPGGIAVFLAGVAGLTLLRRRKAPRAA